MEVSKHLLLICTIWCVLDHSILPRVNAANNAALNCGTSVKFTSRIVAPTGNAKLGESPWIGAMFYHSQRTGQHAFGCASSLISDRWAITAAHCVQSRGDTKLRVIRFGAINNKFNIRETGRKTYTDGIVDKIIPHPGYGSTGPLKNDIALIRFKKPVPFSDYVRPVCLPSSAQKGSNEYHGATVYITGWGAPGANRRDSPSSLKNAFLQVVNSETCARLYGGKKTGIDQSVVCAGSSKSTTCYGDSGGPLTLLNKDDNRVYLVGVVSTGDHCSPRLPAIFTRIAHFMPWISSTIRAN